MKNYFGSDFHFDHANVIKYDNRPFKNVEEMNNAIIDNYNSIVTKQDNFYFLGDFCFNSRSTEYFLKQLNGNLYFIKGNHDKHDTIKLYQKYGVYLGEQKMIRINDKDANRGVQDIVLNHYRMDVWDKSHHGAWHLYGHSHGSLTEDNTKRRFDVGCMCFDYKPIEYAQVKQIMYHKGYVPIDHHK